MKSARKKNLKRGAGLVIPVMVLLLTFTAVGASFAWFSDSSTAEIATINFSTANIFTLEFNVTSYLTTDEYHGQTAYDLGSGRIITEGSDQDYVYEFRSSIRIDTSTAENGVIDLNVIFENIEIGFYTDDKLDATQPNIVLPNTQYTDINNIRYGFTWYFYKENEPNTLYTPYGVGGEAGANSPGVNWNTATPVRQPIPSFGAVQDDTYIFVIVFCPEALYWMKNSTYVDNGIANVDKTFSQIYGTSNQYFDGNSAGDYVRKYIGNEFQGADFKFTVTFNRVMEA